eukprot:5434384-Prymnesium_polylepis.1
MATACRADACTRRALEREERAPHTHASSAVLLPRPLSLLGRRAWRCVRVRSASPRGDRARGARDVSDRRRGQQPRCAVHVHVAGAQRDCVHSPRILLFWRTGCGGADESAKRLSDGSRVGMCSWCGADSGAVPVARAQTQSSGVSRCFLLWAGGAICAAPSLSVVGPRQPVYV